MTDADADAYAYGEGLLMTGFLTGAIGLPTSTLSGGGDLIIGMGRPTYESLL